MKHDGTEVTDEIIPEHHYLDEKGHCVRTDGAELRLNVDYKNIEVEKPEDCVFKCSANLNCKAFEYDIVLKTCKHWLVDIKGNGTEHENY